jgi:signal transduction histidine kinase
MPDRKSSADFVLEALGFALFVRAKDGALHAVGTAPDWLRQLWPSLGIPDAALPIADASPFFENFLIDAEECWLVGGERRALSGPWIEQSESGAQIELDATALTAGGQPMLLIERLGKEFAAKKDVLQKARETVIAHQRLNSEIQKKEILLHCVADEMTSALANIVTSLRLIEAEDNPVRSKVLLGFAMRGTEEQQRLINRVLDVFSEEIGSIYGGQSAEGAADWNAVLRNALEAAKPTFAEKSVRLVPSFAAGSAVKIPANAAHLERILGGLFENALQRTPRGGEVNVAFEEEPDSLFFRVTDSGPRMSAEAYEDTFSKFELPPAGSDPTALRLHFCRVMIESCGGEIGCAPGEAGGNSFWFRLPKVTE